MMKREKSFTMNYSILSIINQLNVFLKMEIFILEMVSLMEQGGLIDINHKTRTFVINSNMLISLSVSSG